MKEAEDLTTDLTTQVRREIIGILSHSPEGESAIIDEILEGYARQYEPFPGFWKRLKSFVNNVQVNDPMSEEEKEMIIHVCDKHKQQ